MLVLFFMIDRIYMRLWMKYVLGINNCVCNVMILLN